MNDKWPTHYRYVDGAYDTMDLGGIYSTPPELLTFRVVGETPCGYWLDVRKRHWEYGKKKWVNKSSRVRYAYPTKKEAMNSYYIRKMYQESYAGFRLDKAKHFNIVAKKMTLLSEEELK